jgi:hypothetical protein
MGRWYKQFGPFSWYKREWFRFCLSIGSWLIVDIHYRPRRSIYLNALGRVGRRSVFGQPSCIDDPWITFARPPLRPADKFDSGYAAAIEHITKEGGTKERGEHHLRVAEGDIEPTDFTLGWIAGCKDVINHTPTVRIGNLEASCSVRWNMLNGKATPPTDPEPRQS